MDPHYSPRHSRRVYVQKTNKGGLAAALARLAPEISNFSPPVSSKETDPAVSAHQLLESFEKVQSDIQDKCVQPNGLQSEIEKVAPSAAGSGDQDFSLSSGPEQIIAKLKSTIKLHPASSLPDYREKQICPKTEASYQVHDVELLPNGKRSETFSNGSIVNKDAMGRVVEIFSRFGDSLFISYDSQGELKSFTRLDSRGSIHSKGHKERNSVTVRDGHGRVKALGDYMTIDPWGRLHLHAADGEYLCLDLTMGIHCERKRLVDTEGKIDFITAAFTHDGYRMATVYAKMRDARGTQRDITYRFYGRDGSVLEFGTDEEFKRLNPSFSVPPGSFPVHPSWLRSRQAHSAWDSVKEYLSLVEPQAKSQTLEPALLAL